MFRPLQIAALLWTLLALPTASRPGDKASLGRFVGPKTAKGRNGPCRTHFRRIDPVPLALPRIKRQLHRASAIRHDAPPVDRAPAVQRLPSIVTKAACSGSSRRPQAIVVAVGTVCCTDGSRIGMRAEFEEYGHAVIGQLTDCRAEQDRLPQVPRPVACVERLTLDPPAEHC